MDFEAKSGRALPARLEQALQLTVLPLQERAGRIVAHSGSNGSGDRCMRYP